jgi:hypothetical protein
MKTIEALLESIKNSLDAICKDLAQGTSIHLVNYTDSPDQYFIAPDFNRKTWDRLPSTGKELLALFVVINERYCFYPSSKNFLINASTYFATGSNINLRLKLFYKLSTMNHVQNQYENLVLEFLEQADTIFNLGDPYLDSESLKRILLAYFATFIVNSRDCLKKLGQPAMLESILPSLVGKTSENNFVAGSLVELISIIKGTYNNDLFQIKITFPSSLR